MYKGLFKFRDLVFIVILIVNCFILGEGFFFYIFVWRLVINVLL